jgi:hypothetical protein
MDLYKVQLSPYGSQGGGIYILLILDIGIRWGEWSASRPGHYLAPRKIPPVPIEQEAARSSELLWTQRLEETLFASAGDRTLFPRSSSL